jgi:hypothetical protein
MWKMFVLKKENCMAKKCRMIGCLGKIATKPGTYLQTGCQMHSPAYQCNVCGRLHTYEGNPFFNRPGNPVYLKKDGLSFDEVQHVTVWRFKTKADFQNRDADNATFLGEAAKVGDLDSVTGKYLLCFNYRTQDWITMEDARLLLAASPKE